MSALEIREADAPVLVVVADLKLDPDLQCRAGGGTRREVVAEYTEAMKRGDQFPPIDVFRTAQGVLLLANGWHRVAAAVGAGVAELLAIVRSGSKKDALTFALSADRNVALRRTSADKRRMIELALTNFPKLSGRKISELCGVDNKTVEAVRRRRDEQTKPGEEIPQSDSEAPTREEIPQLDRLVAKLRKLLGEVPENERAAFADAAIAILAERCEPAAAE